MIDIFVDGLSWSLDLVDDRFVGFFVSVEQVPEDPHDFLFSFKSSDFLEVFEDPFDFFLQTHNGIEMALQGCFLGLFRGHFFPKDL